MAVRIEEVFQVAAPPDAVWAYLTAPQEVVGCLPGANLTEVLDDRTYAGTVKVKVGPVTASYRGKVRITEQDDAARTVRMLGEGMESSGAGSAKMELTSRILALDDGGTEVRVQQDVEVVGKLAQFGRGMVQEVGKQLFRQFIACAKAHLEAEAAEAEGTAEPGVGEPAASGGLPRVQTHEDTGTAVTGGPPGAHSNAPPSRSGAAAGSASAGGHTPGTARSRESEKQDEAIGGIGLFFKALWALMTRPFRRG